MPLVANPTEESTVQPYLRRICSETAPIVSRQADGQSRRENRFYRTVPVLVCAWDKGKPKTDQVIWSVTKNISTHGLGLIVDQHVETETLLVGFWMSRQDPSQPWFFLGANQYSTSIGGGFYSLGIELSEFVNGKHRAELASLLPFAGHLLPPESTDQTETLPENMVE